MTPAADEVAVFATEQLLTEQAKQLADQDARISELKAERDSLRQQLEQANKGAASIAKALNDLADASEAEYGPDAIPGFTLTALRRYAQAIAQLSQEGP